MIFFFFPEFACILLSFFSEVVLFSYPFYGKSAHRSITIILRRVTSSVYLWKIGLFICHAGVWLGEFPQTGLPIPRGYSEPSIYIGYSESTRGTQ